MMYLLWRVSHNVLLTDRPAVQSRADIGKVAQEAGVRFLAVVRPTIVRQRLCGSHQATHAQLTAQLVARYPHLGRYQQNASRLQVEYWKPMFTAVAVGMVGGITLHYGPHVQG